MTFGKTVHEMSMARAHKKAIQRRRHGAVSVSVSALFPTLAEYIGSRPQPRRDCLEDARDGERSQPITDRPHNER
jgi:hypothetical protein